MLAFSPPLAQTGPAARDVLVGCVAENDPRALGQALRLVQSVRWFGGELADAQVMICVAGEIDPGFRQAFEDYGAEVRSSPQQIFSEVRETGRELLLLDCDTVVVQDPLPWMRRGQAEAPGELDFRLDLSRPPEGYFTVDPAILHYGDRVDPEGYLLHSPHPFAQVRIEAFNRRLRQEREGISEARPVRARPALSAGPAPSEPEIERPYLTLPQLDLLEALDNGTALDLDPVPPLSPGARDLLADYRSQQAAARGLRDRLAAHQSALAAHRSELAAGAADFKRALSWLHELDAIFSATLDSRSWKIGRTITAAMRRLTGRRRISAPERRDRLMEEIRRSR